MKYIKQFLVIIAVAFLGEILHALLPFSIPAGVYGLALMLGGLISGIIPKAAVKDAADFLIEVMPVMFVPAGVGVMASWPELRPALLPVLMIIVVTTILVMAAAGRISQFVIRKGKQSAAVKKEKICRKF